MKGAPLSSCYIVSLLCLLFQMCCGVEMRGYPPIYARAKAVLHNYFWLRLRCTAIAWGHAIATPKDGPGGTREGADAP
jgi:hypothetical protein